MKAPVYSEKKPELAVGAAGALLLCSGFLVTGCHREASTAAIRPTVAAVHVSRGNLAQTVTFPVEFHPWYEVSLHAKVAGFVKSLSVDLGSRVKQGDTLAELEIPLLDEDIAGARALLRKNQSDVKRAEAAYENAHISFTRLSAVAKNDPKLLAQQDIDTALEKDRSADAALAAAREQVQVAQAALDRLLAEQAETHIIAPFDGVVTELDANPGDLVQGGTSPSGQGKPLVHLAETSRLRASFPVSTSNLNQVKIGMPVEISFDDGHVVHTKVARLSDDVSWATRTMRVEADVPNENLSVVPGMYASATLTPIQRQATLVLPIQAIQRGKVPEVWTVDGDNALREVPITIGVETSTRVEVLTGVIEGQVVLLGNPAALPAGQKVQPQFVSTIASR
jgi:RND family efflux transporter MFP subunit